MQLKKNINYVGIELELISKLSEDAMNKLLNLKSFRKLRPLLVTTTDGSIESDDDDYPHEVELNFITPQNKLKSNLMLLKRFLSRVGVKTNDTCGLHVHLDMRNRDVKKSFKNLHATKFFLQTLVDKSRIDNDNCEIGEAHESDFDVIDKFKHIWFNRNHFLNSLYKRGIRDGQIRYERLVEKQRKYLVNSGRFGGRDAINLLAYSEHKTIEVRLHHGTVDTEEVYNWATLLCSIVDNKKNPTKIIQNSTEFTEFMGNLNPKVKEHIEICHLLYA